MVFFKRNEFPKENLSWRFILQANHLAIQLSSSNQNQSSHRFLPQWPFKSLTAALSSLNNNLPEIPAHSHDLCTSLSLSLALNLCSLFFLSTGMTSSLWFGNGVCRGRGAGARGQTDMFRFEMGSVTQRGDGTEGEREKQSKRWCCFHKSLNFWGGSTIVQFC